MIDDGSYSILKEQSPKTCFTFLYVNFQLVNRVVMCGSAWYCDCSGIENN